jgi:hypothetical protein
MHKKRGANPSNENIIDAKKRSVNASEKKKYLNLASGESMSRTAAREIVTMKHHRERSLLVKTSANRHSPTKIIIGLLL